MLSWPTFQIEFCAAVCDGNDVGLVVAPQHELVGLEQYFLVWVFLLGLLAFANLQFLFIEFCDDVIDLKCLLLGNRVFARTDDQVL